MPAPVQPSWEDFLADFRTKLKDNANTLGKAFVALKSGEIKLEDMREKLAEGATGICNLYYSTLDYERLGKAANDQAKIDALDETKKQVDAFRKKEKPT